MPFAMGDVKINDLHEEQRRGLIKVMLSLCRGNYQTSLRELRLENPLPVRESDILETILLRLMKPNTGEEMEPELVAKMARTMTMLEQLNKQGVDTTMPDEVLFDVYEKALILNFDEFRNYLIEAQLVEHSKLDNALLLNTFSKKLAIAKNHMKKLDLSVWFGVDMKLLFIYGLIFLLAGILVVQLT